MKIMIVIHLTKMKLRRKSPIIFGFSELELSKLHRYEPYYDKLLPYFGEKILQCLYFDTDAFIPSFV